ncbi:MAG: hypothetical protein ACI8TL_001838, partial [Natronomonas sp.]
ESGASGLAGFRPEVAVAAFATGVASLGISGVTPHADLCREDSIFCLVEIGHTGVPFSVLLTVSSSVCSLEAVSFTPSAPLLSCIPP